MILSDGKPGIVADDLRADRLPGSPGEVWRESALNCPQVWWRLPKRRAPFLKIRANLVSVHFRDKPIQAGVRLEENPFQGELGAVMRMQVEIGLPRRRSLHARRCG